MIHLQARPVPAELTEAIVQQLTEEYAQTGNSVWKKSYIERELLLLSHNKCAYCECFVHEESKYMEVEHFRPKSLHPELVVDWGNLLPSCKRCNGTKNNHDVEREPILHPILDEPKEHLVMKFYRLYPHGNSGLGRMTIEVLDLNERERLVYVRYRIGCELAEKLEKLYVDIERASLPLSARQVRTYTRTLQNLLAEAQPTQDYAATAATVLLTDEHYRLIKAWFVAQGLWSAELTALETGALACSLAA